MSELKPCPHCGHRVTFDWNPEFDEIVGIYCSWCHALTKFTRIGKWDLNETAGEYQEKWTEAWNYRNTGEDMIHHAGSTPERMGYDK